MKDATRTVGERSKVSAPARRVRRDDMPDRMLHLQRTIGNRALAGLVAGGRELMSGRPKRLQATLTVDVDASNDPLEQEADRTPDQVLAAPLAPADNGTAPDIQRVAGEPTDQTHTA